MRLYLINKLYRLIMKLIEIKIYKIKKLYYSIRMLTIIMQI